jgi:hypothetical protein
MRKTVGLLNLFARCVLGLLRVSEVVWYCRENPGWVVCLVEEVEMSGSKITGSKALGSRLCHQAAVSPSM